MTDQELQATQEQLLQLLRTSPTLTTVVARDPSLLSNQEYVSKNNPQLAQFLVQHPDIARNPGVLPLHQSQFSRRTAFAGA